MLFNFFQKDLLSLEAKMTIRLLVSNLTKFAFSEL